MIEYITLMLSFMYLRKKFKLYIIKRDNHKYQKIQEGAEPFILKKGETGILCLHGFSSSAWDYRNLGKYLADKGYTIYAPLIAGHGTSPEHLSATKKEDWIDSVEQAYYKLKRQCDNIIIIGDSFGGNLAMLLAAKHDVNGIIVMGSPLFFKKKALLKSIYLLLRTFKLYKTKKYHSILDREVIKNRQTYKKIPLNCISDLEKVINKSKLGLNKITAPTLIMQSTTDLIVASNTPQYIYDNIQSKKKEISWIKDAYHVIIIDRKKQEAFEKIYSFLKSIDL